MKKLRERMFYLFSYMLSYWYLVIVNKDCLRQDDMLCKKNSDWNKISWHVVVMTKISLKATKMFFLSGFLRWVMASYTTTHQSDKVRAVWVISVEKCLYFSPSVLVSLIGQIIESQWVGCLLTVNQICVQTTSTSSPDKCRTAEILRVKVLINIFF